MIEQDNGTPESGSNPQLPTNDQKPNPVLDEPQQDPKFDAALADTADKTGSQVLGENKSTAKFLLTGEAEQEPVPSQINQPASQTPTEEKTPVSASLDKGRWGVLIQSEIKDKKLIQVPDPEYDEERCYKHASYDLRLGHEYMSPHEIGRSGQLKVSRCDGNGIITIKRFASVIISSYESVKLPVNVAGRFDLRIRHAFEGLIVQVGTQIEPGYDGPLFALVHNISERDVSLKVRDYDTRPFTVEFCYTSQPSIPPKIKKKKNTLADFVPSTVARGGIDRAMEKVENVGAQIAPAKLVFATAGLIVVLVATISIVIPFTLAKFTYDKDYFPLVNTQAIAAMKNDEVIAKVLEELEKRSTKDHLYEERLVFLKARRDTLKKDKSKIKELQSVEKEIDQIIEILKN